MALYGKLKFMMRGRGSGSPKSATIGSGGGFDIDISGGVTPIEPNLRALLVLAQGDLTFRLIEDDSYKTITVPVGMKIDGDVAGIDGATTTASVFGLY